LGLWKLIHVRRDGEKERCHCVMKWVKYTYCSNLMGQRW
jgi:hypothetical protein